MQAATLHVSKVLDLESKTGSQDSQNLAIVKVSMGKV